MGKIKYQTLRENVESVIRDKILRQELAPGTRVIEQALANELGVSRGPIREALRQLESEGLVEYTRNAGCKVRMISLQDIYELYLMRANYEVLSVKVAETLFVEEEIEEMTRTVRAMDPSLIRDYDDMSELDNRFHRVIAAKCGLKHIYNNWDSLSYCGMLASCYSNRPMDYLISIQEKNHKELLSVIKDGDRDKICKRIIYHYMNPVKELMDEQGIDYCQNAFDLV